MRATHPTLSVLFVLLLAVTAATVNPANAQEKLNPYEKWLSEDVRWIITDQERIDFEKLSDNAQRDDFVVSFWERRNPHPGSGENNFKEEHYQRLAYANQHFAAGVPGWKTDRGRFYIMYGPPNKIVRHLHSGKAPLDKLQREDDFPSEEWHWEHIRGIGSDVILKFVNSCGCGEYQLAGGENGPN
jgi:GWxTD domain-containing protein